ELVTQNPGGGVADRGARFGVVREDGCASLIASNDQARGAWHFDGDRWVSEPTLLAGLSIEGSDAIAVRQGRDQGVRLRDLDGDGRSELIVGAPHQRAVFEFEPNVGWKTLPFALPEGTSLVDDQGRDAGLRFADIDQDGYTDVIFSNESSYSAHLFESREQ